MNYRYEQAYELAVEEAYQATIAMDGHEVCIVGVNEHIFVRWQAALQGLAEARRKFFEEPRPAVSDILTIA